MSSKTLPQPKDATLDVARPTILLVDDREDNLLILKKSLSTLNAEILTATSGSEALGLLENHDFALFLFDVVMPGMGGLELAENIRSGANHKHTPIIFITAQNAEESHIFDGYQSGAVDYLLRPVKPQVLRGKVQVFLELFANRKTQEAYAAKLEAADLNSKQYIDQLEKLVQRTNEMAIEAEFASIQLKQIFDASSDGMWVIDRNLDIVRVNRVLCEMIGAAEKDIVGRKCYDIFPCSLCGGPKCPHSMIYKHGKRVEYDAEKILSDGTKTFFILTGAPYRSLNGAMTGIVEGFKNITERKLAEEALNRANLELKRLAVTDGLTRIANRRRFTECIEREWQRLARDENTLAVIMCDVDFFKLYNDQYGHKVGDDCLQSIAQAIDGCVHRAADLVARYGGEEFVVLLPNTPIEGAIEVANTIREAVENLNIPHEASRVNEFVTLSLGVAAMVPLPEIGYEKLVILADEALYRAKGEGRNRVVST